MSPTIVKVNVSGTVQTQRTNTTDTPNATQNSRRISIGPGIYSAPASTDQNAVQSGLNRISDVNLRNNITLYLASPKTPDDCKQAIISLLTEASQLDGNNIYHAGRAVEIGQELQALLNKYSYCFDGTKNDKVQQDEIHEDAKDIAEQLAEEITDTVFDDDKFEAATSRITKDNVLEVLNAYPATKDGRSFWTALKDEWMTAETKKGWFDKILTPLEQRVAEINDPELTTKFNAFKRLFNREYGKGMFDGFVKETEVQQEFDKLLEEINKKENEKRKANGLGEMQTFEKTQNTVEHRWCWDGWF